MSRWCGPWDDEANYCLRPEHRLPLGASGRQDVIPQFLARPQQLIASDQPQRTALPHHQLWHTPCAHGAQRGLCAGHALGRGVRAHLAFDL